MPKASAINRIRTATPRIINPAIVEPEMDSGIVGRTVARDLYAMTEGKSVQGACRMTGCCEITAHTLKIVLMLVSGVDLAVTTVKVMEE